MTEEEKNESAPIAAAIIASEGRVLMVRRRVKEGKLSWQFPAGEVEKGERGDEAAVRETREEVGVEVSAIRVLGERVHPNTGRTMVYVACELNGDQTAQVVDTEELAELAWCDQALLNEYVPYPFFEPVQDYLNTKLK
ncbi:NUDIX hydrolase [Streptomyces mirabilis]|uniref:NUDIX hydrolase n=1 Tax=Streptomyces mirabilis TaxID=68239 RepID=UPI00342C6CD0